MMQQGLARLTELSGEMVARREEEDGLSELSAEGSLLLCLLREEHLKIFLEPRLRADASSDLREGVAMAEELRAHRELHAFLERRIAETSSFTVSEAARKLLQVEADARAGALLDHDGSVALLTAERESRMALLRELDRLLEVRRALQADLAARRAFLEAVPQRLAELAARLLQTQDSFAALPLARRLQPLEVPALHPWLQRLFLHLSAFVDAALPGQAAVAARAKTGGATVVELDFNRRKGGGHYCLHFGLDEGQQQVLVEAVRGPGSTAATNCLSLMFLFPGDAGAAVAGAPLGRSYGWLDRIARDGDAAAVAELFALLEKRFVAQKYLAPQLDLLCKLQVHSISVHGARLVPQCRLVQFAELPHQAAARVFLARVELPGAPHALLARVLLAPDYPRTRPLLRFELAGGAAQGGVALPDWTAGKLHAAALGRLPPSRPADSVLAGLESAVNAARPPRDANFDLSTRMAKVLLAFDLYCFAVLGVDAARATWNLARASCQGRDRRIECDEF